MKAAVVSAARDIDKGGLDRLLEKFNRAVATSRFQDVQSLARVFNVVLPAEVCTILESMKDRHVVVVHDTDTSRIPWETLTVKDWTAAVEGGLSRRYLADHLPVATWLEERRIEPSLKLLLVVNPLGDLAGAEEEGDRIAKLAGGSIEVTQLRQKDATKAAILAALRTGRYDCVHYAGHAFFDPQGPGRSGLICAHEEILSGADLIGISNLPSLIFFNACEAGRIRGRKDAKRKRDSAQPKETPKPAKPATRVGMESAGVAEALMRGGVANLYECTGPWTMQPQKRSRPRSIKASDEQTIGDALLSGARPFSNSEIAIGPITFCTAISTFVLKQAGK
jgi:hypothetical protein